MNDKNADEKPLSDFGRRLMQAIDVAGYTQTGLAAAIGYSTASHISKVAEREPASLELELVRRLRLFLGVRTDWLLWGEGQMRESTAALAGEPFRLAMRDAATNKIALVSAVVDVVIEVCSEQAKREGWSDEDWYLRLVRGQQKYAALKIARTKQLRSLAAQARHDKRKAWVDMKATRAAEKKRATEESQQAIDDHDAIADEVKKAGGIRGPA